MEELIAARIVQAIGGGGLGTVVSILLTDLVPSQDRGVWQGVVNIVYALGAGLGAPIGGFVAGTVGWRWSFFGQVPVCVFAFFVVGWSLNVSPDRTSSGAARETLKEKLRRVDFMGSGTLILSIASFMFGLDRGSNVSWVIPETLISFFLSVISASAFFYIEARIAKEPIIPPAVFFSARLRPIYLASFFCFFSLVALEYTLPLYYQATAKLSPQKASFYLVPPVIGGTSVAMLTGLWMRRTGQYYWALVLAFTVQSVGALLAFSCPGPIISDTRALLVSHIISELGVGNAVVSGLIAVSKYTRLRNATLQRASHFVLTIEHSREWCRHQRRGGDSRILLLPQPRIGARCFSRIHRDSDILA